ncbi:hypothetical protein Pcinc_042341 [Petrolisthes cinctipes]|uniref:Cathepsin L n=1 Tax=Petrolisthes cinctipes TaxID=88211 RepID=A0AAE1BHW0_PETCI|nr:hypothetical protein Pcinc_042341 [Petrolisthes cinctipes]
MTVLLSSVSAVSFFSVVLDEWEAFKLEHGKRYHNHVEDSLRMKIFVENKHKIAEHNQLHSRGHKSYRLKMNQFGDMLHHEFTSTMNGLLSTNTSYQRVYKGATYIAPDDSIVVALPSTVDWRDKGAVTPVKNQGNCGSCWSFSATGSLEGQHYRKTGKLVSLSEQNLVDCSRNYGNNGCNGGLMDYAFQYIKDNGGIDSEHSYPYIGNTNEGCLYNPKTSGADDYGFVDIPEGDEVALMKAVAIVGPIAIAIDASQDTFQFYSHGVYDEPACQPKVLDHGVLAVGYGTNENGTDYWLVKNSWGETWGDHGYIKMIRNHDNQCGAATMASYPIV